MCNSRIRCLSQSHLSDTMNPERGKIMIRETHSAVCPEQYLTAAGLDPERVIYFDIETTGLRASTSQLYMIGWAVRVRNDSSGMDNFSSDQENPWIVTQIMAESYAEETLLLREFADELVKYDTIVEFNGDRFDLPYMREKYASHRMTDPFEGLRTVDLYQKIRPCRTLLGMTRLNQKSVEQFLHITREDPYNGGELINVYRSVRSHSSDDIDASIRSLFLHNYEDVLGMLEMTPVISYPMISCCDAPVSWRLLDADGAPIAEDTESLSEAASFLEASFSLCVPVPRNIETDMGSYRIDVTGDTVCITIPLELRTMYHFFPDYRDYYYLPEEDTAIHKSVACFVDPAYRKKATQQNCYVKKEGIFLPQREERFQPCFRSSCKDKTSCFELTRELLQDEESFSSWIHSLIP